MTSEAGAPREKDLDFNLGPPGSLGSLEDRGVERGIVWFGQPARRSCPGRLKRRLPHNPEFPFMSLHTPQARLSLCAKTHAGVFEQEQNGKHLKVCEHNRQLCRGKRLQRQNQKYLRLHGEAAKPLAELTKQAAKASSVLSQSEFKNLPDSVPHPWVQPPAPAVCTKHQEIL